MPKRKLEMLVVNQTGPVKRMKFRPWWLYFFIIVFLLMLAGLGAGGYFFFLQNKEVRALAIDTSQLQKANEALTTQVHDLKTMAQLAAHSDQASETPTSTATTTTTSTTTTSTTTTTERPKEEQRTSGAGEPITSDKVGVRIVRKTVTSSRISLVYDVINKNERGGPVTGYVTVVARGNRASKPWIEAAPPMRLSPLGRPLNFRRGEAFSVQRFRRFRASFQVADKKLVRLEFLLYSREGDLILVDMVPVKGPLPKAGARQGPGRN